MTATRANFISPVARIAPGGFGHLASVSASPIALIPAAGGVALALHGAGIARANTHAAHLAAALTLELRIVLTRPLRGALGRGDTAAAVRVAVMTSARHAALDAFARGARR
ncbi:MAG: hypothetical protein MUF00_03620 [Gemmatimonadaceae bacterium]|jgi:hypothetical protein|nr:hypothetical protein [Gemmatimonadaceae bacterium]